MPNELLLTEPRSIAVRPYSEEPLAAGDVRAEAIVSGISHGTELALYRGVSPFDGKHFDTDLRVFVDDAARAAYPMRLGYEWVGKVTEAGAEVRAPRVRDLVHLSLPHRETQTFAVDDERKLLTPLPADLDPERGALLASATIALQAIHDARLKVGDVVAVFGLGVFGLLAVQLARLSGARWIAGVDPIAARRELAGRLGADVVLDPAAADVGSEIKLGAGRGGVDVAIEFSGRYSALHAALRSVRLAGTVVAAGFYSGGAGDELRLGEEWHHNRLTLVSSMSGWGAPHREAGWDRPRLRATVLELIASGRLEVDALVTQRIAFAQAAGAYDLIDREPEAALKVLLEYRARG